MSRDDGVYDIGDKLRRRVTEALRSNEALLRQFVEHTPAAVAMFDREIRYLLYSKRWLTDYKLGDRDITGLSHYEVFPDVPERWKEIHQRVLAGSVEQCDEDPFERADGHVEWIKWEVQPWWNDAGEIGGIIMFTEVITERKRTEERLRRSEQRFRDLFERAADGLFLHDLNGRFIEVNQTACDNLGYSRDELLKLSVSDIVTDYDADALADLWDNLINSGPVTVPATHRRRDGSTLPVEGRLSPFMYDDQLLILAVVRDITERKEAEEALRAKTEELDLFFAIALDLLCIADIDGYFRLVNPAWEQTLGYSKAELEGRRFLDFVHPDDLQSTQNAIAELASGKVILDFTNRYLCRDGSYKWLEWRSKPYQQRLICAAARDITQRRLAEDEKREFYRETIRSVTEGKLNLASLEDVKPYLDFADVFVGVSCPADTMRARHQVAEYSARHGLDGERLELFELAVGEAITNAVKHAGGGEVHAGTRDGSVWAAVSDNGPGISTLTLPGATLRRGFSTKTSMGMGYSIMMEASNNILLYTGPQGTIVVLLIDTTPAKRALSLDDLPDTWNAVSTSCS